VPGVEWQQIVDVAFVAREVLTDAGLSAWPKTSGSRGFHIYAPVDPVWTYPQLRLAAEAVAREVEHRAPGLATSRWWKEERHGVFVDFNQNAKDRTVASAYSVRATPDARVSTPLRWDEVRQVRPEDHTLSTVPARFAEIGDPRAGIDAEPRSLEKLLELAERLGPVEKRRRGPGGERSVCRSSRWPEPARNRKRSSASSPGEGSTPTSCRCWRTLTCSSMACAAAAQCGFACGSTSSTSRRRNARAGRARG